MNVDRPGAEGLAYDSSYRACGRHVSDAQARPPGNDGPLGSTYANGWVTRGGYVNENWFSNVSISLSDPRGARMLGMSGVLSTEPIPPAGTLMVVE